MLNDVPIVGERGLDYDLFLDLAVQTKAWVPLVVQGISKVTFQVHTIQSVRWRENTNNKSTSILYNGIINIIPVIVITKVFVDNVLEICSSVYGV